MTFYACKKRILHMAMHQIVQPYAEFFYFSSRKTRERVLNFSAAPGEAAIFAMDFCG